MRFGFIALSALLLVGHEARAQLLAAPDANPLGKWRGTSRCVARQSACKDETVVYDITQRRARKDSLSIASRKLVDGREVDAGVLACDLNAARAIITCAIESGKWRFAVRHDSLVGQLRLRDGTWLRDVHANRSATEQPRLAVPDSDYFRERSARDLSGAWVSGSTDEPTVRRIITRPPCNYTPAAWFLEQHGDSIFAWNRAAHQAQGVATRIVAPPPRAVGRVVGSKLTMTIDTKRYVLVYDSLSGHLRGTVNGAPFWAVPQEIVSPRGCVPPPS